ncbi:MAG TPA: class I SAM-dependent methyltransferase [Gaiellaceae bacterium]|nr:class I SAM-dependent methyltransferase [Gaiellaceae bacterium]
MGQFHFEPERYLELMHEEVPRYEELQEEAARASAAVAASRILELGVGTGETSLRVLARHPGARLVGIDASGEMLAEARRALPGAELAVGRLEEPLPSGPFDLAVSALAVHHLDGAGKRDLFARVRGVLRPGGRFVLADVVVPERETDAVTPLTPGFDLPDRVDDQLAWLETAGFAARVAWLAGDLAVLAADVPAAPVDESPAFLDEADTDTSPVRR